MYHLLHYYNPIVSLDNLAVQLLFIYHFVGVTIVSLPEIPFSCVPSILRWIYLVRHFFEAEF